MNQLGVTESYKLKRQVIMSASEAAEMILRYDACSRSTFEYSANYHTLGWMTFFAQPPDGARQCRDVEI